MLQVASAVNKITMRRRRLHYGSLEFSIDGSFRVEQTVEGVWLFGLFENWPNYTPKTFKKHFFTMGATNHSDAMSMASTTTEMSEIFMYK